MATWAERDRTDLVADLIDIRFAVRQLRTHSTVRSNPLLRRLVGEIGEHADRGALLACTLRLKGGAVELPVDPEAKAA